MLPNGWVERIFQKLTLIYGRDFTGRWEGMDLKQVMADWSHELSGFADKPECIAFGLENIPADKPPTVLQFRDVCRRAPTPAFKALQEPKADPGRVKAALDQCLRRVA